MKLKDVYISDIEGIPFYYSSLKNGISVALNLLISGCFGFFIYWQRENNWFISVFVLVGLFFLVNSYFALLRFKRKKPIFMLRTDELYCVDLNESFNLHRCRFEIVDGHHEVLSSYFEVSDGNRQHLSMNCWLIKDVHELESRIKYYKLKHLKALRDAKNE